jgi:hypothetical protein
MPRCLRPQAAANHGSALMRARRRQHLVDIGNVAEGADAGQAKTRNRRRQRPRAGGDQQPIVRNAEATRGGDGLGFAVDRGDRVAGKEANAIAVIPFAGIDDDLVDALVARKDAREHDAIIVDVRLGSEHGDAVAPPVFVLEQLLDRTHAGHAVTDDHEVFARVCKHVHVTASLNVYRGGRGVVRDFLAAAHRGGRNSANAATGSTAKTIMPNMSLNACRGTRPGRERSCRANRRSQ